MFYFILWILYNIFIHSVINGHLCCLQLGATGNSATINTLVPVYWWTYLWTSVRYISRSWTARLYGVHAQLVYKTSFPKWLRQCTLPPAQYMSSICSTSLSTTLGIFHHFYCSHYGGCIVISQCDLIFISLSSNLTIFPRQLTDISDLKPRHGSHVTVPFYISPAIVSN